MFEKILPIADYLKDKSIYPLARVLLNLIFIGSISSYIYVGNYHEYHLLDWNDFDGIYSFFIKGEFFVPLSIFSIIWLITYLFSYLLFYMFNYFVTEKWRRKILNYSSEQTPYQAAKFTIKTKEEVEKRIPQKLDKRWYVKLYQILKAEMSPDAYKQLNKAMEDLKINMTDNFILIFRGMIATSVYFAVLPEFGWVLFGLTVIAFIVLALLFVIGFQFGELLPSAVYKFSIEMEKAIEVHKRSEQLVSE